ncbi:S-adenosyl-L-methionine-dependent methyltransferase [Aspergillus desertorum]
MSDHAIAQAKIALAQLASLDACDAGSHGEIVRQCQSVVDALQNPLLVAGNLISSITMYPSLVALENLGVFQKLCQGPLSAAQIAQQTGADHDLVVRLMRVAVSWGYIRETGPQSYASTAVSNVLAHPSFAAGLRYCHHLSKSTHYIPKFLKETNYRNPASYEDGLFQYSFKTKLGQFQWTAAHPEHQRDFDMFMTIPRTTGAPWPTQFNVGKLIFEDGVDIDTTVPLFVDIGGGYGQDLHHLKSELQSLPYAVTKGQLVVEDQPSVIDDVPADMRDGDFTYVKHDFFNPQPVQGARVYSFKTVLHNWADEKALQILRHTAASFTPGYSKLWILDRVVPDTGADKVTSWQDMIMMATLGALERTEDQWTQLLAKAGLKINSIQTLADHFGLIEAVLE